MATISSQILSNVFIGTGKKAASLESICFSCINAARCGYVDFSIETAAYGIMHALETGRLPGAIDIATRNLTGKKAAQLVTEAAAACPTVSDVPRWLIAR